ncbi:DUF1648 domain-containing protein [Candidatus Bathyarchaeota archaeon]|nr:DUF1648 domain-containing protein [Candidatus Bathyarchaeota archaeon]
MEKTFRPTQTKNTMVWGLILVALIDIPLLLIFFLGIQGPIFFSILMGGILILIDGLVLSLAFLGKRMNYKLEKDDLTVNFGFRKRKIPYSSICNVQLSSTKLLLRLFGASWPGLHWGLYKAKDVGHVWVYSTKMKGDFILINLVDEKKIAISPEDPKIFLDAINAWKSRFGTDSPSEVKTFETTRKMVYAQVLAVAAAFAVFLGYLLWIYPSLPEIIPVHFDFNWNPNRWAHKSELFILAGTVAIFPIINTILTIKFGRYAKEILIFLGVIFISVIALFLYILYFIQSIV